MRDALQGWHEHMTTKVPDSSTHTRNMLYSDSAVSRSFRGEGGRAEYFIALKAPAQLDFREQVQFLRRHYDEFRKALGIGDDTAIFQRIFLSDILNQLPILRESGLIENLTATSIVQQAPLPGAKIALLAYHAGGGDLPSRRRLSPNHLLMEANGSRHLWSTRLCAQDEADSAFAQTRDVFSELSDALAAESGTLLDHCVRTWIFVKDIDLFYQEMADSRRGFFAAHGLDASTHYISSTGIEGACAHVHDLIAMDAYSNLSLRPGQMSYLNDFDRLCATKDYNITFERGTRIAYADRAHFYLSGTASIDKTGAVVHPGDVMRQLERTLDNMAVLLQSGGASLSDLMYLIVYLRDASEYARVDAYLCERFPFLPTVIVRAPVCRPGWLIEAEGVAITGNGDPAYPPF